MTEPRKSTVYDYADLRLHPDGTRVYQKSTNLRPKLVHSTIQDARSNWIATDAGGSAKVPLFKKRKRDILEDQELEHKDGNIRAGSSGDDGVDNEGKRKPRRPDHRKAKRQKFLQGDDYLGDPSTTNVGGSSHLNFLSLPHPSPDLLKCVHRFASEFYTERGQLLNSSRQYRKERKERRVKQAVDRDSSPSSHSTSSSESQPKTAEYEDHLDEDASESDGEDIPVGPKRRKRRKGRRRSEKLYVDMYKVFDGSAMMALGMLVQEHIAYLLEPSVPESWEREVRSSYTDPWGDSTQLEGNGATPEHGKELQGVVDGVADETDHGWASEKDDDEAARSDDTRHSSDSEAEYR